MASNKRISLEPSVLRLGEREQDDVLLGCRCRDCGRYFFPARVRCAACAEPTTDPVELSREGTLVSYTLITRKPRYAQVDPPYILGEVLMPEGIRIYTYVNSPGTGDLCVGQGARLKTLEIKKDDEGNSVIAFSFAPVA